MKPNFALSLSFEGIKLLHRAAGGWREVGEVPVTADDLGGELAMLRKTAASLEPGGVRTKLLIPASQIKYLTIDTIGLSEAARRKAAETALHDATPYEVSELAYDISMDGAKTHIAAVARETLAEAEAFATEHRFHPVSFVAVPGDAPYLGEPFFGTTQVAAALLEPEETVEPDGIAVVIVGAIAPEFAAPVMTPEVASEPTPSPEDTATEQTNEQPAAVKEAAPAAPVQEDAPAASVPVAKQADKPASDDAPVADTSAPDSPSVAATAEPIVAAEKLASTKVEDKQEAAPAQKAQTPETVEQAATPVEQAAAPVKETTAPAAAEPTPTPVAKEAAPVVKAPEPAKAAAPAPQMPPKVEATAQPELALEPVAQANPAIKEPVAPPADPEPEIVEQAAEKPAEAAKPPAPQEAKTPEAPPERQEPVDPKRAALLAAAAASGASAQEPKPQSFKAAAPAPDVAAPSLTPPATGFASRRATAPSAKPVGGAQRIAVPTPKPDSSSLTKPAEVAAAVGTAAAPVAAAARSIGGFLSRRKPRKGAAAPMPAPKVVVAATGSEAERMTVFGARTADVGGKPRFLGLIMTVILLVFLAGVAAWAAVFLDDGIAGLLQKEKTRATASAPENQIDPEVIRAPDGIDPAQTDTSANVQVAALDPVLSAEETATVEAAQNPRPEPEVPVISEAEAAARYAVTGIWPLAPTTPLSDPDTVDAPVYRSSIDAISSASDALALPAPQEIDNGVQLAAAISPPPFGQRTDVDENGLIVPSVDGVVTPGGFTLFSASPPLKPPVTLARFAAQPTVTAPEATSALAGLRPQNRPLGLSERSERAQLGGVSRGELAAFRPSLRPRSLQDRAKEADDAAKQATEQEEARAKAAQQSAAAAAAAALLVPTTPAAVAPAAIVGTRLAAARSIRPDTRPRNFSRIVNRAQRAAPREETRVAAAAATVAPRTVTPSLPSKASVARSATVKNAINLRKVNLIGIYGKPSSRRALVRLGNGRYQKVKVGDRIDGGRVGAISDSQLSYTKSGRSVVLKMP